MLPYKTIIQINREEKTPMYLQICNSFIKNISAGIISSGLKLPGSRTLATLLEVNRRTIITAYEELEAQGWAEIKPNQGCFVSSKLPLVKPRSLEGKSKDDNIRETSLYTINDKFDFLDHYVPPNLTGEKLVIDAGYPDIRLAPLKELAQNIATINKGKYTSKLMNYSDHFNGDIKLRKEIAKYLVETRSIHVSIENIMIIRGSLMAFHLIFRILLKTGDNVIVGSPSFQVANKIIKIAGGNLIEIPVDENGIDVDKVEIVCKKKKIRAVFIMPHHHNPTTVSLSAERRMKLLQLAERYKFAIIEDDYDYNFHYDSSPILPMASSDRSGVVIYVGSLSKTIAPGLRTGFIVAPINLINEISRLSRFIDCHGNMALERAIAMLFVNGEINRYMKKALKTYHARRDYFCELLKSKLGNCVEFKIPEGGMAVWVKFDKKIPLNILREKVMQKGLLIPKSVYKDKNGNDLNAIRMGFASLCEQEMEQAFIIFLKMF